MPDNFVRRGVDLCELEGIPGTALVRIKIVLEISKISEIVSVQL